LRDMGTDGKIILKWILKKYYVRGWTGLTSSWQGLVVDTCEHGNKTLGLINGGLLLEEMSHCQFLNKASASWTKYVCYCL
jgi:hypothetical protein